MSSEARQRIRPLKHDRPREAVENTAASQPLDLVRDLPGIVFMVPNRQWAFFNRNFVDHPGACVHSRPEQHHAVLVKGTDADKVPRRTRYDHYLVSPTRTNGLEKQTAFKLAPRYLRLHKVRLLDPERCLGRLDDAELRAPLARAFDQD
jgi:hypothetical protein